MHFLSGDIPRMWKNPHVPVPFESAYGTYNSKNIYISPSINYDALLQEFKTHLSIVSQSKKYVI